jgi:hypothetical protein
VGSSLASGKQVNDITDNRQNRAKEEKHKDKAKLIEKKK